jgi:hypothetical protein
MKLSFAIFLVASAFAADAFAPSASCVNNRSSSLNGAMSEDVGIPCEDECAIEKFPNLPESIHPGVLSGKAMMDLLQHAKDNGTFFFALDVGVFVCLFFPCQTDFCNQTYLFLYRFIKSQTLFLSSLLLFSSLTTPYRIRNSCRELCF